MRPLLALFRRDLALALRRPADTLLPVAFVALALSLFPLAVGPAAAILERIGSGVIWVLALFATTFSLERLWAADHEDGSLEQMALAPVPLEAVVIARTAAHWLVTGAVVTLLSPLLAVLLAMPSEALWLVPLSLLVGTPTLALLGGIGAALLLGSRRGPSLTALLVLPLEIPVLIFGVAVVEGGLSGLGWTTPCLILAAILLATAALAPFAAAAALRLALE